MPGPRGPPGQGKFMPRDGGGGAPPNMHARGGAGAGGAPGPQRPMMNPPGVGNGGRGPPGMLTHAGGRPLGMDQQQQQQPNRGGGAGGGPGGPPGMDRGGPFPMGESRCHLSLRLEVALASAPASCLSVLVVVGLVNTVSGCLAFVAFFFSSCLFFSPGGPTRHSLGALRLLFGMFCLGRGFTVPARHIFTHGAVCCLLVTLFLARGCAPLPRRLFSAARFDSASFPATFSPKFVFCLSAPRVMFHALPWTCCSYIAVTHPCHAFA